MRTEQTTQTTTATTGSVRVPAGASRWARFWEALRRSLGAMAV